MAETFAMIKGTEAGCRIRAAIVDMKGELDFRNWEESASSAMGHVWMTDCDSLYEHLISQRLNAIENKRLAIDLMALRQQIWERNGERTLEVDHSCGDYPRWIDTRSAYKVHGSRLTGSDHDDRPIRHATYGRVFDDQREESRKPQEE